MTKPDDQPAQRSRRWLHKVRRGETVTFALRDGSTITITPHPGQQVCYLLAADTQVDGTPPAAIQSP